MPITINGTTVTTIRINGTSISKETVNGTQVYGGTVSKEWVFIYDSTSSPYPLDLGVIESSRGTSNWLYEITMYWSPNYYPVGTTGCVWDGDSMYYVYQVQEV